LFRGTLTDEQHAFARKLVIAGRYPSVSAVVAQGLELLKARTDAESMEMEALKLLLEERQGGVFVSTDAMRNRLAVMTKRKRRNAGLLG
jgi:antitoxin ParD1/3/4